MKPHPPLVGVYLDTSMSYGRGICTGIMRYIQEHARWRIVLNMVPNNVAARTRVKLDGVLASIADTDTWEWLRSQTRRIVNVSSRFEAPGAAWVHGSDTSIGRTAGAYGRSIGVGHLGYYGLGAADRLRAHRIEGVRSQADAGEMSLHVFGEHGAPAQWSDLLHWLKGLPKPALVIGEGDYEALLLHQACWECGIEVPQELAILGVNNDEVLCQAVRNGISSVEMPFDEIGYRAAEAMDALLKGGSPPPKPVTVDALRVNERGSSNIIQVGDPAFARAIQLLREHACDPCSVAQIADWAGMNRRQFEVSLRRLLGRSPHQEMVRIRLQKAESLLKTTRLTQNEIARLCGYPHAPNFSRVFREHHQMTPGAYREQHAHAKRPDHNF